MAQNVRPDLGQPKYTTREFGKNVVQVIIPIFELGTHFREIVHVTWEGKKPKKSPFLRESVQFANLAFLSLLGGTAGQNAQNETSYFGQSPTYFELSVKQIVLVIICERRKW